MSWWSRFNNWIDSGIDKAATSPLKDWEQFEEVFAPSAPSTAPRWSDVRSTSGETAPVVTPIISDPTESDPVSEEKSEPGDVTTETTLEHADDLPGSTFRVFPTSINHRNVYDTKASVRRAVAYRHSRTQSYWWNGVWMPQPTKVYEAHTVWRDVTDEYVKP